MTVPLEGILFITQGMDGIGNGRLQGLEADRQESYGDGCGSGRERAVARFTKLMEAITRIKRAITEKM